MDYGDLQYDLERCQDLLEEERYEDAFDLARELLDRAPRNADVVCVYSDAAVSWSRPSLAIRACQKLLRGGETDVTVLEWLARAQWDLHLTEQCRRTCRRILKREPDNYVALDFGLATVLELQDFDEAGDLVDRAAENCAGDPHLTYQTAVARMMRNEEDWALETFEKFLAEDPEEPGTYINLMRIHHLAERYERVEELYRAARARGLGHEDLYFNMGLALKAQEREREAARYFLRSVRKNGLLPDAHFHLGQILRNEGHPRLALLMLQRELMVDDTHPAVHAEMAWCEEDLGEYADAVRMIRAAAERAPEWGIYRHSLAELLLRADPASPEAEAVARGAVETDPEHAAGWQVLGRLAADGGDLDEAERCLKRAVAAQDATAEDQGWLGLLLAESGRKDEARPLLEGAVRTFPFWEPVGDALGRIRGHPLPYRFEVTLSGRDGGGRAWYRVLHVVSGTEADARNAVEPDSPVERGEVEEVRELGFEVDRDLGIVWDSGPSKRRYPEPPPPEPKDA